MSRHAPLGLKLNPQVDFVLGHAVILVIDAWLFVVEAAFPLVAPLAFAAFALVTVPVGGPSLSLIIAAAFDSIAVAMLHVAALHRFLARLLRAQLSMLRTLSLLMRGKKRNVLRLRIDTLQTDGAQLMLGSMMFAILLFTLQTTLAHHFLVLVAWTAVLVVERVLWLAAVALHTMPSLRELLGFSSRRKTTRRNGRAKLVCVGENTWDVEDVPPTLVERFAAWARTVRKEWADSMQSSASPPLSLHGMFRALVLGEAVELPRVPLL